MPRDLPAECRDDRPEQHLGDRPGAELREAREARGLSIEDLTRATKITGATLVAIENNDREKLPATIFTRGFVKAYAREVGLDPDATADRYLAHGHTEDEAAATARAPHKPAPSANTHVEPVADHRSARDLEVEERRGFSRIVPLAAAIGLAFYIWSVSARQRPADQPAPGIETAGDAVRAGGQSPSPADPAVAASVPAADLPGPLQFELRPQAPCWLSANVDGSPLFAKLLQAGEHQTIEVRDEIVMRVGDPAALSFSINGQSGRALGRAGEPVSVRITKDNFRDFLSS